MPFFLSGYAGLMKKIVTLQVRILKYKKKIIYFACCGKKVLLPASMTLEAALVLSLFIFASVSLILPMKIMATERRIQSGLEAVGEDLSRYIYVVDMLEKGREESIPGANDFDRSFCKNFGVGAVKGYAQEQALRHADTDQLIHANMLRSSILEDDEICDLILDYEIRMPFPVLGISAIPRTARSRRRAWIGKEGKDEGAGGEYGNGEKEIVYVGRNSTRYHRDRSCHYLSNTLTALTFQQVAEKRNAGGKRYTACAVCGHSAAAGSVVYIMPSGSSYHTEEQCRAIIAYVRAVKLSEVEHLGECSYCSR